MGIHISRRRRRRHRDHHLRRYARRRILSAAAVLLAFGVCCVLGYIAASHLAPEIEHADEQLTVYEDIEGEPSIYVNNQWYAQKDMENLLLIGVDDMGAIQGADSYNNGSQADFIVLLMRDRKSGETAALHINRDTMTDVPVLGVMGDAAGTRREQIALAYYYGQGDQVSCENTVQAVSNLLYGVEIDHYFAITMDAVSIMNDWAGGVKLEVMDDFSGVDPDLVKGQETILWDDDALHYVQARAGMQDSSNLRRMERQRQYAWAWFEQCQPLFRDYESMADLFSRLQGYFYSDCTLEQLQNLSTDYSGKLPEDIYTLKGEAAVDSVYMEYHVDEAALQQQVLDLFYEPVEG